MLFKTTDCKKALLYECNAINGVNYAFNFFLFYFLFKPELLFVGFQIF